jgi:putative ABC transport system permease protein
MQTSSLTIDMLQNYLKVAWRNIIRNKTYSALLIASLTTGMTCAMILGLYVYDELRFDQYHKNAANIYRVNLDIKWDKNQLRMAQSSAPFGPALQAEYPEVKNTLRIKTGSQILRAGEKIFNAKSMIYADSSLFSFFDYDFSEGNAHTALAGLNGVVLTQKTALAMFGKTSGLIGKTVFTKEKLPFTISAIIREIPASHHLRFDAVLPYMNQAVSGFAPDNWGSFNTVTYLMLDNKSERGKLQSKLPAFYKKYVAKQVGDDTGTKVKFDITLQPLADMRLKSSHLMGEESGNTMQYIYMVSIIGIFILVIAIINYINLATARSISRGKEIGVRKSVGSNKFQLIWQFLAESALMAFLAGTISVFLLYLLLPIFNELADTRLTLAVFGIKGIVLFVGIVLITSLISGFYPAFILSGFKPVAVLKGAAANGQGFLLRKSLVVLQFGISVVMIFGTIVVNRQLQYMEKAKLGFNQQHVISIPLSGPEAQQSALVLKEKLLQSPLIASVSLTNGSVGEGLNNKSTFSFYANGIENAVSTEYFHVDADFLDVLQIHLSEGSNFSDYPDNDSTDAVLVNKAMLKHLGWKNRRSGLVEIDARKVEITGVVDDFHLRSLHNRIEPLVLVLKKQKASKLLIRVSGRHVPASLRYARKTFEQLNPGAVFEYAFLDQTFGQQYRSDERRGDLFLLFSAIAIAIACMGLFGLATFTAQQRTKEIGVRKVLGASITSIVALLSRDFLKLVLIAIVIASPVGWYLMDNWLRTFAYKTEIVWWVFVLAGLLSIVIALFTVSFQSIRAGLTNPVKSLRAE